MASFLARFSAIQKITENREFNQIKIFFKYVFWIIQREIFLGVRYTLSSFVIAFQMLVLAHLIYSVSNRNCCGLEGKSVCVLELQTKLE